MSDLTRAGSLGKGAPRLKQVKVEKPRPLKTVLSQEDLLIMVDGVTNRVVSRQFDDQLVGQLANLCANLKLAGPQLELSQKAVMDKLNSALMSACKDDNLDLIARVHMLEIIELRTMGWKTNENVTNYYKQKLAQIETEAKQSSLSGSKTAPVILNPSAPDFSPQSGLRKHSDSSPPPSLLNIHEFNRSKTSSKAESNFKFPAVNKLEMSSNHGKMRNNGDFHKTSPQPKVISPTNFSSIVQVGTDILTVSGASHELVNTAKIVLHEFFNLCPPEDSMRESSATPEKEESRLGARRKNTSGEKIVTDEDLDLDGPPETVLVKPDISYEKSELMALSSHPLSKVVPDKWSEVVANMPGVVRRADRAGPTSKIILKEMEEIRRQEAAQSKHV